VKSPSPACATVGVLALLGCGDAAEASTANAAAPCTIAEVAGVAISDDDARAIVGLLRPPPTRDQARRLVVAAAAAACEVDCSELALAPRPYSSWLGHYRASGGGSDPVSGTPAPLRSERIRWASGPDACGTDHIAGDDGPMRSVASTKKENSDAGT